MTALPRCFGVLGDPIAHSRSPVMHQAAFAALGLPHRYLAFRVGPGALGAALQGARALGFGGLNLTVPLKRAALGHVDTLSADAEQIGAINTIAFDERGIHGHNTDAGGFARALQSLDPTVPRSVVVLGAGGASLAVVHALRGAYPDAHIAWISRRPIDDPRGCESGDYGQLNHRMTGADLLVNTTTVGMGGGPSGFPVEVPIGAMARGARVVDLVYPRPPGGLLDRAEAAGHRVQDGLPMLLWQGVLALQIWLGRELPPEAITAMGAALGSG